MANFIVNTIIVSGTGYKNNLKVHKVIKLDEYQENIPEAKIIRDTVTNPNLPIDNQIDSGIQKLLLEVSPGFFYIGDKEFYYYNNKGSMVVDVNSAIEITDKDQIPRQLYNKTNLYHLKNDIDNHFIIPMGHIHQGPSPITIHVVGDLNIPPDSPGLYEIYRNTVFPQRSAEDIIITNTGTTNAERRNLLNNLSWPLSFKITEPYSFTYNYTNEIGTALSPAYMRYDSGSGFLYITGDVELFENYVFILEFETDYQERFVSEVDVNPLKREIKDAILVINPLAQTIDAQLSLSLQNLEPNIKSQKIPITAQVVDAKGNIVKNTSISVSIVEELVIKYNDGTPQEKTLKTKLIEDVTSNDIIKVTLSEDLPTDHITNLIRNGVDTGPVHVRADEPDVLYLPKYAKIVGDKTKPITETGVAYFYVEPTNRLKNEKSPQRIIVEVRNQNLSVTIIKQVILYGANNSGEAIYPHMYNGNVSEFNLRHKSVEGDFISSDLDRIYISSNNNINPLSFHNIQLYPRISKYYSYSAIPLPSIITVEGGELILETTQGPNSTSLDPYFTQVWGQDTGIQIEYLIHEDALLNLQMEQVYS